MSQTTPTGAEAPAKARTVTLIDRGSALDVRALVLLAVLLAAGFILNYTIGKAISSTSGGMISPEFIISAFCLTILIVRPSAAQALIIGLISAAVIQLSTTGPFIDFAAEGVAAVAMALICRVGARGGLARFVPVAGTFVTTALSGTIFMLIKMAIMGFTRNLVPLMLPVILLTAVFNAVLVGALYLPIRHALGLTE